MTTHKYGVEKFQTPNTDADIEKCLLGALKFTKGKTDGSYEMWPDEEIHSIYITHSAYEKAIENFRHSVNKVVTSFESKGYELTDEQKKWAVKGLLDGYKYYSLTDEDRQTYSAFIMAALYKSYADDGILEVENRETGFSEKYRTTRSVIDYLKAGGKYTGAYGKTQMMSKAESIVHELHNATSLAYKSLHIELKKMNYRDSLVKMSETDEREELRKTLIDYLGKQ